jgi:adenylate kinase family enzyme
MKQESELGEEIRSYIDEQKNKLLEERMGSIEKEKGALKYRPTKELSEQDLVVAMPTQILTKLYKQELNQNKYYNKGFILDGYPETYEQAVRLFKEPRDLEG